MRQDLIVSQSVDVNVDLARMWRVLTDPTIIKDYLFGTETVTDWKVGSPVFFQGEYNGHQYKDKGIILENFLHQRIQYSYWSAFSNLEDKPENYSTITYELNFVSDSLTTFTWTQKGYATEEAYKSSVNGMPEFIEKIRMIAEEVSV
jgi:uncharacterized protein YndB with AHSA1/START domain